MKPLLILILSLFFTINAFGQKIPPIDSNFISKAETKNLKVNGLKEGKWGEYVDVTADWNITADTSSSYYRIATYVHDTLQGMAGIYGDFGCYYIIPYVNGRKNGIARSYLKYYITIPYKDDKINGVLKRYFFPDGILFSDCPYVDGIADGTAKEYDENGKVGRETVYVKGKEVSDNAYDEEGKMENAPFLYQAQYPDSGFTNKAEANNMTVNGLKEGKWIEYYRHDDPDTPRAATYELIVYRRDTPVGIVRLYLLDGGNLIATMPYLNGKINGVVNDYNNLGKVNEEETYVNGLLNGLTKEYYEPGKLESVTMYKDGKMNGERKEYYKSGKLFKEAKYSDGKEDGVFKWYYENGTLMKATRYEDGNEIKQ
jgi:antitoxin component YwqK of YwqJK toxin-antitoxin module